MSLKLRDYQREAITEINRRRVEDGHTRIPLVLATGLGKTVIFTTFVDEWLAVNPGRRALIIAHTDELIEQAAAKMRAVAPGRRVGIVKANQNEVLAEIVVSSRQTLASKARRDQLRHVGLIIVDECHHATRHNTYGKILEHFGAFDEKDCNCTDCIPYGSSTPEYTSCNNHIQNGTHWKEDGGWSCVTCNGTGRVDAGNVLTVGFTATLVRSDKQKLSSVWQDCTFTRDILFGIRHGYLLDVRGERITVPDMDMSRVRISSGDYRDTDLAEELERTFAPEVIARDYARLARHEGADVPLGPQYRRGIAFWPLVDTAYHGAKAFNEVGIRSDVVHGAMPKNERRALLQRFRLPLSHPEAIDVMHNAMVLTEGFDEPTADVVVVARPTRAAGLYQQMVGRVLRPDLTVAPELREKALILDVTGAGEHGLRSLIDLSPERKLQPKPDDENASLLELDEYLLEIEQELDAQRAGGSFTFESDLYDGETIAKAFDPLGRDTVWGRTPDGHYYIKAGSVGFVFLADSINGDPGTYDVVMCSAYAYLRDGITPWVKGTRHQGLPLDMALNWGEDVAMSIGGQGTKTLVKRKSKWRGGQPSEAQLKYAAGLHIDATGMSKGELSEAIDSINAQRRIDPIVKMVKAREAANPRD